MTHTTNEYHGILETDNIGTINEQTERIYATAIYNIATTDNYVWHVFFFVKNLLFFLFNDPL